MRTPPRWSEDQLKQGLAKAKHQFRQERMEESVEVYPKAFDQYQGAVEDLLETTGDLTHLDEAFMEILTARKLLEAFRYLAGPPISDDDLMVLAEAQLSPSRLRSNNEMARRVLNVVRVSLDRRRFPWVTEQREPTEAERKAAVVASAALLANSRVSTARRNEAKARQELQVEEALLARHFRKIATKTVRTITEAPAPGEFCRESMFGTSKADFLIGLWDRRTMAVECKVSNSSTNSVKRLNHEAAGKAEKWIHEFGALGVVPVAVLSGVYKIHNLLNAQTRGLTLYWAHDLGQLLDWIEAERPNAATR